MTTTQTRPTSRQQFVEDHRSAHLMLRDLELATKPSGLGESATTLILVLLQHGPMALSYAAKVLVQEAQSITSLADRMERLGFVQRMPSKKDRRVINLELTELGESKALEIDGILLKAGSDE